MECPICGETLPLSSKVCDSCGHEYDGFFLTEEFASSTVRKSAAPQKPPRRQPSALKPGRPPLGRKKIAIIAGAAVLLIAAAIAVFMFMPTSFSAAGAPDAAVTKYYQYLQDGNAEGMFSLFESGFQPMEQVKAAVKAALATNKYTVKPPVVTVVRQVDNVADVKIESVEVTSLPKSGGTPKKQSLAAYAESLPGNNPKLVSMVKVSNNGEGWQITGRPVSGWSPENMWLIGEIQAP
jgi:hypothetical protein